MTTTIFLPFSTVSRLGTARGSWRRQRGPVQGHPGPVEREVSGDRPRRLLLAARAGHLDRVLGGASRLPEAPGLRVGGGEDVEQGRRRSAGPRCGLLGEADGLGTVPQLRVGARRE